MLLLTFKITILHSIYSYMGLGEPIYGGNCSTAPCMLLQAKSLAPNRARLRIPI